MRGLVNQLSQFPSTDLLAALLMLPNGPDAALDSEEAIQVLNLCLFPLL